VDWAARILYLWLAIYVSDVRPAVRVRKRQREDDLISHLIDEGAGAGEILSECITVAAAGMVTTREFICAAAWHLFTDDALLAASRAGDEQARFAILHEVARLEPPLAALKRRTTAPVTLPDGTVIAAGERVDVSIAAANLDQAAAPGLTFGDGPHKCPGAYLAVQEADIFLTTLFALDGVRLTSPPRVAFNDAFGSYSLHDMVVSVGDRTVEA
jgi:cytochrome P450